jgi:hypothetical protein
MMMSLELVDVVLTTKNEKHNNVKLELILTLVAQPN